jgi:broad specificity phosphatase PhoE
MEDTRLTCSIQIMAPKLITLVRHGEGHHNVGPKYHLHDPYLTELGESQCRLLWGKFPQEPTPTLIVSSPLKRTLQTTIIGFTPFISSGKTPVIVMAELQETSSMPCDTGSPSEDLARDPALQLPGDAKPIDYSVLPGDWATKTGRWADDIGTLTSRATAVRRWLKDQHQEHIVCVLHGGFLHYLTEDWTGNGDFPGTGWRNTEFRQYVLDGETLVETAESRAGRTDKPLGNTEQMQFLESHPKN